MLRGFLFSVYILIFSFLSAQQFGGNPPSLKWKQINSDTARIIYPTGLDRQAQRVAAVVHFLAAKNTSLGNRLHKINIVMQNQGTIANGYAGLGPLRSEFFMTPSVNNFDLGSIGWAEQLALHEYRHIQQFNNFRTGLSNMMYYLFGEEGLALAINASIPDWFYEGDAVYNETVHTEQGRGRIPFFTNQYRLLWLANKNYSWMKLRNGSLKDFVPSHYHLGYMLVNYGYEKYGADFWKKVTQDAAAFKGLFYPFQHAIKKYTGTDYKTFRKEAFDFYKNLLQTTPGEKGLGSFSIDKPELQELNGASQQKFNQGFEAGKQNISGAAKNYVINYFFPYQLGNDSLLYLKSSYRRRPAFFIKDETGEHPLRIKDISLDEQFSYRNGKIVYAAYKPDARRGWRDYGEIRVLDVKTKQQQTLTHKTKYFSPDISEDGKKIAAVHIDPSGKSELHILDAGSGQLLRQLHSSEIGLFTDPEFTDNNTVVTAVRLNNGQMVLAQADINSGVIERLTPPSYNVIGFLNAYRSNVYFTASYAGNDDLFAFNLITKKIYRIRAGQPGNYFVNVKDDKIVYAAFTAEGYQLQQLQLSDLHRAEVNPMAWQEMAQRTPVAGAGEYANLQLNNIPDRNFLSSQYRKGTRLINFHSWRPYYEDPEFTFSLYGENVLNTLQTELYYLYNQNEKTHAAGFNTVYGALSPHISAGAEYTFSRTDTLNNLTRQWNQLDTRVGLNVPLNFSGGRFFRFMNFGSSYVFRMESNTGPNKNLFVENNFSYLSHFISYSQQVQMARQHIFPRLGYSVSLQHRHAITKYNSYQFIGSGNLYLPGFASTHSFVLNGSFQQRDTFRLLFSNRFVYSRGYNEFYFSRMWKLGANYHFPLWLPDWGFGNILYIHRIRANAFYDFTKVYSRDKTVTVNQRSAGGEIYFDTNWWNQYPLTFGIRISRLLDDDLLTGQRGTFFEFILPVSIIPR
jgi:hypothetical protein